MRCPACGHTNSELATRCSACGSPLPVGTTVSESDDTLPRDPSGPGGTAARPQAPSEAPRPEVSKAAGLRGVLASVGAFFGAHQRALGLGLAGCVVLVIAAVWLFVGFTDAPTYTQIEDDLAARYSSYVYDGGTYGPDLTVSLSSVSVTKRQRAQAPQDAPNVRGSYDVGVELVFEDAKMRVVQEIAATYVREDGEWSLRGEPSEQGTSLTARAGVDEAKALANMEAILDAATPVGAESLSAMYANGDFTLVGNTFDGSPSQDTATNDLVIHCAKDASFYGYAGNVTARFAFESGTWRLRTAEADTGTAQRNYSPLVGTWSGTLVAHDAEGGSCYGAQNNPLTVIIGGAEDTAGGGGKIEGTLSGIVHYHGHLDNDASTHDGDTLLEATGFTGIISPTYDTGTGSALNVECDVQAGGQIEMAAQDAAIDFGMGRSEGDDTRMATAEASMQLSFGTDEDPTLVVARVTTTYSYEELLLMLFPHQTTARFTDTYLLSRVS